MMTRLYASARLFVNFFQPSFKLKEKRREGSKVIKRYHAPSTPYERALAHPHVTPAVKQQLCEQYRTLDPVTLLAEIRAAQEELGNRIDRRVGGAHSEQRDGKAIAPHTVQSSALDAIAFAKKLGRTADAGDPRATHRRPKRRYKTRVHMPSKLDPHIATIENWLATEPQLTALAIVNRLSDKYPEQFGKKQHSIVQRLLKSLRNKAAKTALYAAWRHNHRHLIARVCGRLGLWRARPVHSPLAHSSLKSLDAVRIGRRRIVGNDGDSVTFPDAAIRGSNLEAD